MPVAFDTSGMEQYDERTWFCPRTGDQVSLTYIDLVPDLPAPLADLPLLRHRLALETAEVGALIEAHVVMIDSVPALYQLLKLPIPNQDSGQAFIAAFTVPRATCSVVLRIQCAEGENAGARESAVIAQVGPEAFVRPHPYAPALEGRLPWHVGDEERWDGRFPEHPLSRARTWANRTVNTARIDPAFAQLPSFRPDGPGPNDHTDFHAPVERPALPPASSESSGKQPSGSHHRPDPEPLDVPVLEAPSLVESTSQLAAQSSETSASRRASRHAKAEEDASAPPATRRSKLDSQSAWQLPPTDGEPPAETIGARASRTRRAADEAAVAQKSTHRMTQSDDLKAAPEPSGAGRIVSPNSTPPPFPLGSPDTTGSRRVVPAGGNPNDGARQDGFSGAGPPPAADGAFPGAGRVVPTRSGTFPAVSPGASPGSYPEVSPASGSAQPGAHPGGSPNSANARPGGPPNPNGGRAGGFPDASPATAGARPGAFPDVSPGTTGARPGAFPETSPGTTGARPGAFPEVSAASNNVQPGAYPNNPANAHPGTLANSSPGADGARPGAFPHDSPGTTGARPGALPEVSPASSGVQRRGYPNDANARPGAFPDGSPNGASGRPGAYPDSSPGATGARPGAFPEVSPASNNIQPGAYLNGANARPGAFPDSSPGTVGARPGAFPDASGMAGSGAFPEVSPASSSVQPGAFPNGANARPGGFPNASPGTASPGTAGGFPEVSPGTSNARPGGFPDSPSQAHPGAVPSARPGGFPDSPSQAHPGAVPSARPGAFPEVAPATGGAFSDAPTVGGPGAFRDPGLGTTAARPGGFPEIAAGNNGRPDAASTREITPGATNGHPGAFPEISPSAINGYPGAYPPPGLANGQDRPFPGGAPNGFPDPAAARSGVFPAARPGAAPDGRPALPPATGAANGHPAASGTFPAVSPGNGAFPGGAPNRFPDPAATRSGTFPPAPDGQGSFMEIAPEFPTARAFHDNALDATNAHPPSAVGRPVASPGAYPSGMADPIGSPQAMGIQRPGQLSPAMPRTGEPPVGAGDVMHTVLIGLPIGGYLPLWHENAISYWRLTDPVAVRTRLGIGIESRTEIDNRRFREAALFTPERNTLFLTDRFRNGQGNLGGASTQLIPATEDEAYRAANDKAMSEFYSWLGDVVVAAGQRGEYVAIETGGWHVPVTPVVLIMLRADGREWHSVVETSPVPHGAPVWRDQQPVGGDTQLLASPATDRTMRAAGLLTRFAVATWPMHPFQLGLSFGPNPTLGDVATR